MYGHNKIGNYNNYSYQSCNYYSLFKDSSTLHADIDECLIAETCGVDTTCKNIVGGFICQPTSKQMWTTPIATSRPRFMCNQAPYVHT